VNLGFRKSVVQGVVSFSVLMCLELYVNEQFIKTATLIYLIFISHPEKDKNGTSRLKVSNSVFRIQCLLLYGGWEKLNMRKRR
jgi:hypothetical protein